MLTFAAEPALELEAELRALLPAHMAEFNPYSAPLEAVSDYETYRKLASSGILVAVSARAEGELVGYWLGVKCGDPHHRIGGKPVMLLSSMAFYIAPLWRARAASSFFKAIEAVAVQEGVALLGHRVRPGGTSGRFLEALGYKMTEMVYVKPIGEAEECRISV